MIDFDIDLFKNVLTFGQQLVAFHSRLQILDYASLCWGMGGYDLHFWYKPNAIPFVHNTWKSDVEYIALGWRSLNHASAKQADKSKVWVQPIETENLHPAQKPLGLLSKYIRILQAQLILDPFMGSGSTLVAAKKLNRKCIGIEISEKYCEIAAKRCQQMVLPFDVEQKPSSYYQEVLIK